MEQKPNKDSYTVTEVGVLIDSFRKEVSTIAEGVSDLNLRMDRVEVRLEGIEHRFILCEDAVRIAIPDLYKRVTRLEAKSA